MGFVRKIIITGLVKEVFGNDNVFVSGDHASISVRNEGMLGRFSVGSIYLNQGNAISLDEKYDFLWTKFCLNYRNVFSKFPSVFRAYERRESL